MSGPEAPDSADEAGGLPVRRRSDVAGCGCPHCRGLSVRTLRRDLVETVRWSGAFCRRHPSVVVGALALWTASTLLEGTGPRYLPTAAVESLEPLLAVAIFVGLRAYVATLAARDLTGGDRSTLSWWGRAVGRSLALVVAILLAISLLSLLGTAVEMAVFVAFMLAGVNPMELFGLLPVFVGTVLLFLLPTVVVLFSCWFALEATIIGRYGPIESIRVSTAITTSYWDKLLRVFGGLALGIAFSAVSPGTVGVPPGVALSVVADAVGVAVGAVSTVVWFAVSAHIYVQSVADV